VGPVISEGRPADMHPHLLGQFDRQGCVSRIGGYILCDQQAKAAARMSMATARATACPHAIVPRRKKLSRDGGWRIDWTMGASPERAVCSGEGARLAPITATPEKEGKL